MSRYPRILALVAAFLVTTLLPSLAAAQAFSNFGAGVKASTLGIGIEGATTLTARSNLRFGVNLFNYNHQLTTHGVNYGAALNLRSVQVTYDQYLLRGFHVSPGLLLYNGNKVDATAAVPAGQSFTLGDNRYYSSQTNPISGTGKVKLGKTAPMVLFGFGNLIPRAERHIGVNFDMGVVFQGSPQTTLNLAGSACAISPTSGCVNAATDSIVQSNIRLEQDKLNEDLQPLKYYPVVSIGVSWKF